MANIDNDKDHNLRLIPTLIWAFLNSFHAFYGCEIFCQMNDFIEVNGKQFNKSELSEDVLQHLSIMDVSKQNINDLNLQLQFLNKARDAYVAEVKAEINSSVSDFTFGDN